MSFPVGLFLKRPFSVVLQCKEGILNYKSSVVDFVVVYLLCSVLSLRLCFAGSSLAAGGSSGSAVQPDGRL